MQGVEPVNDELEVGYNERFETSWTRIEVVGRVVMILYVAAALAGLLGHGPLSHHQVVDSTGTLAVDYEPVARFGTETQITFHVLHPPPADSEVALTVSNGFGEPFGLSSTMPQPLRQIIGAQGTTMIFPIRPGAQDELIRLKGTPMSTGPIHLSAHLDDGPSVPWLQFVLP